MTTGLVVFALACLACALFFALDYGRIRKELRACQSRAEFWRTRDALDEKAARSWAESYAEALDDRPARDPVTGKYVKRRT